MQLKQNHGKAVLYFRMFDRFLDINVCIKDYKRYCHKTITDAVAVLHYIYAVLRYIYGVLHYIYTELHYILMLYQILVNQQTTRHTTKP